MRSLWLGLVVLLAACGGSETEKSSGTAPAATCDDGVQNADETAVDCGGSCTPCAVAPTCDDGVQNGEETDVDCGGADCDACPVAATCEDGTQNGEETGTDCGGPNCNACVPDEACSDGIINQDESDVDCGGNVCPTCLPGQLCGADPDCESGNCGGGYCLQSTCQDNVMNGTETGTDCGGLSCGKCEQGGGCLANIDCLSGECDPIALSCVAYASCADILANGLSTGDGMYSIDPDGGMGPEPYQQVFCDMTTDGGGWTVVASWNRQQGSDNVASFQALMTEDFNNMGQFSNAGTAGAGGFIRWSDGDSSYDAMAYHFDVVVPNTGEALSTLRYIGDSMEASGVWFFATAAGVQNNLLCWDDSLSTLASYDMATEQVWIPSGYTCPNLDPVLTTTTWTWDRTDQFAFGAAVDSFHIHSLMGDCCIDGGDSSDLYRFSLAVR
jgi:hypothetical protein